MLAIASRLGLTRTVARRYISTSSSAPLIVSTAWLAENIKDVITVDATWFMPGVERDPYQEYLKTHLPNARFFPIDEVKDDANPLPHMLPPKNKFADFVGHKLGISRDSHIVVYDSHGVFSAPRALWTFKVCQKCIVNESNSKVFGHPNVSVLDGGLPKWTAEERATETGEVQVTAVEYPATDPDLSLVRTYDQTRRNATLGPSSAEFEILLDARSKERFSGQAPEPRPQLPSGHVPHSISLPFQALLTQNKPSTLRPANELRRVFADHGIVNEAQQDGDTAPDIPTASLVASCGSGLSACIIWLAARVAGIHSNVAVYDGSWTEWAEKEKDKGGDALIDKGV